MKENFISIIKEEQSTSILNDNTKLDSNDAYSCSNCLYPVEIFKIDDKKNTITFKCLNPKEKQIKKIIPINEYLNSMKKYTYPYSECSLCKRKQNEFKYTPIFSYCIKCGVIICSDCIDKHIEINEKNHPALNSENIIKNNEKSIKCLLHPKEKNLSFCLKCNIHLCKECLKSEKHINHSKVNLIEILVTDETKNILNGIINIYKERIIQLNKEKEKKEIELLNEKEKNKEKIIQQKKIKIKEIQKRLKKELLENETLLNYNLYKLKLKYVNLVKLLKSNFNISNKNINTKYEKLSLFYNKKFQEEINNIEKEYNNNIINLEYNKKINIAKNLLLINQLLKNAQENYSNNYYYNKNVNNIILKYYESKDKDIKQILSKKVYNELYKKEKDEKEYKNSIKELEKLKNVDNNIINGKNNQIIMTYKIDKEKNIRILGKKFVKNNKKNCKLIINKKEYKIREYIECNKYDINKNDDFFTVILIEIKNKRLTNLSFMFCDCELLTSLYLCSFSTNNVVDMSWMFYKCYSLIELNLSSFNTKNVTDMNHMFAYCTSLTSINLSSFNTKNVSTIGGMFSKCSSLTTLNLSSFNFRKGVDTWGIFNGCGKLNREIIDKFRF